MKGRYNGSYMRAFRIVPRSLVKNVNLSKDALRRLTWIDWHFTHGKNVSLTCRHFNISRDTFYLWFRKFNKRNLTSLENRSRRPRHTREMTTPKAARELVMEIRRDDPEKSKYEIQEQLRRLGINIGYNTVQKIINRTPDLRKLQHKKRLKVKRKLKIARIKAARELKERYPGSLVQIDTKHLYILGQRFYVFAALDCKSRYGFIWAYKTGSSLSGADFLLKVLDYFPFIIEACNTDNGAEFLNLFHKTCKKLGVIHYFAHPQTPKMNARVERFIQTVEYEFFNWQDDLLPEIEDVKGKCAVFNHKYNTKRFSQVLGYKTPNEYVTLFKEQKGELYAI